MYLQYEKDLNHRDANIRLSSLRKLSEMLNKGDIDKPIKGQDVNNHIHTIYSFSPYSPSKAVWMSYKAGLATAGIMDHDSISGAAEFIEAGKILGISTTIGVECRADFSDTPLKGKRINNPDQKSIAYVALHGIPHTEINDVKEFFKPYVIERNKRNAQMVSGLNEKFLNSINIQIDFERDVMPLSMCHEGGSITERHILYALALKLVDKYGKGINLVNILKKELSLNIGLKAEEFLLDDNNPYYEYDLLGALKSDMVEKFYIDAKSECPSIREVIDFSKSIGAISAYAYLGDVGDSVTGDKKTQKFEDDYLELLFKVLKDLGFNAVTYMPSRNTLSQLKRVKELCVRHELFQISGEDINSPRQNFLCEALRKEEFKNLIDAAWALIGHEISATKSMDEGMFAEGIIAKYPNLGERIELFKETAIAYLCSPHVSISS